MKQKIITCLKTDFDNAYEVHYTKYTLNSVRKALEKL